MTTASCSLHTNVHYRPVPLARSFGYALCYNSRHLADAATAVIGNMTLPLTLSEIGYLTNDTSETIQ